jgi:hypothetical protein
MKPTASQMADAIIAWLEQFELNHLQNEGQAFLADDLVLETSRRADQARRRDEWDVALRDCELALAGATGWRRRTGQDESKAKKTAIYSEAVARLYTGAVLLARSETPKGHLTKDPETARSHLQWSTRSFGELERWRAESIAWAAISMVNAVRKEWTEALGACQESIVVIDRMTPPDLVVEELRRQIVQMFRAMMRWYEQGI